MLVHYQLCYSPILRFWRLQKYEISRNQTAKLNRLQPNDILRVLYKTKLTDIMKRLILMVLLTPVLQAQKPEKIHPFARHHYSTAYLQEQQALWKKETEKEPRNPENWYNYYYVNRNLYFADTTRMVRKKQYEVTSALIGEMEKHIADSYEYNLVKWLHGSWDMKLIPYLRKAQALGPDRPEHVDYSIVLAEMDGNIAARDKWSGKKNEAGQFSTGLMYYNYNVLSGLPPNTILLTSGDNDTYPIWYLQSLGIRKDVTILHTTMINLQEYRDAVLKKLNVKSWTGTVTPWHDEKEKTNIVTWLSGQVARPVCVALTANHHAKCAPAENMYLTGLVYSYSKTPMDNIALLKRNFEQVYALDYLDKTFFPDISEDIVRIVNGNYIVPMLRLYEHYSAAGDIYQAGRMKRLLLAIVKDTDSEEDVKKKLAAL